jgi:TPR repeat protein
MSAKCPACKSFNVRRSSILPAELSSHPRLRSPYRCRDCGERFWVLSRRAHWFIGFAAIALVAGTVAWNGAGPPDERGRQSVQAQPVASEFADTLKRAQASDPVAEFRLSQMYAHGNGVAEDKKEARNWLQRSAEHGNTDAQLELGNALREGLGGVQDYGRAAMWLQQAAENGNADAQYSLGLMYRWGMGVAPDLAKAYIWFNLAAAQGVTGAEPQRDAALRLLTPSQVAAAQAEASRLSEALPKQSAMAR